MVQSLEDMQKVGQEGFERATSSFSTFAKGFQAVAADSAEYARRSFQSSTSAFESLAASRSWEQAIQVQTDYVRSAYEGFMSQSSKVSEMVGDLAREAYKPYEGLFNKPGTL